MRKFFPVMIMLAICIIFFSNTFAQDYVGAGKCKMCHKSEKNGQQYPLWEARKHSKSYQALSMEKAKEYSPDIPAVENSKCLTCHAPLTDKAPDFKEEGVTCEVCHGAGSDYKKLSIMKDQAEAVKNGLTEYGSIDAIKAKCLSCHENAHNITFDFEAAWEKVKHPIPADKQ